MRFCPAVIEDVAPPPGRRWRRPDFSYVPISPQQSVLPPHVSKTPCETLILNSSTCTPSVVSSPHTPTMSYPIRPPVGCAIPHIRQKGKNVLDCEVDHNDEYCRGSGGGADEIEEDAIHDDDDDQFVDAADYASVRFDPVEKVSIHQSVKPSPELVLPAPPTTRRPGFENSSLSPLLRRSIPIFIALLVAVLLLIGLTLSFFVELEKIDAELHAHYRSPLSNDEPKTLPLRHTRRLTSIEQPEDLQQIRRTWNILEHRFPKQFITTFSLLLSSYMLTFSLKYFPKRQLERIKLGDDANSVKISLLHNSGTSVQFQLHQRNTKLQKLPQQTPAPKSVSRPHTVLSLVNGIHPVPPDSPPVPISQSLFAGAQTGPRNNEASANFPGKTLGKPPHILSKGISQTFSLIPPAPAIILQPIPTAAAVAVKAPMSVSGTPKIVPLPASLASGVSPKPLSAQVILHQGPINVVNVVNDGSSQLFNSPSPRPLSPVHGLQSEASVVTPLASVSPAFISSIVTPPLNFVPNDKQLISMQGLPPSSQLNVESVEVWHLPRGRHLCRFFNAARIEDGRLLVPKWMEKHKEFISERCGVANCVYGINTENGKAEIDAGVASAQLGNSFVIDTTFQDRDLFSSDAPRQHMPHYVSDVIKPLIAAEVLLGSGRNMLMPFSLLRTGPASKLVPSSHLMRKIKPALLMLPETWKRPESDWVRRLANFFQNPALGFVMVKLDRRLRQEKGDGKLKVRMFQSIMATNVNPYEPYGLFGTTGKNVVFAINGISRAPPWTMDSMREHPCRVSITALTRVGARALLELDVLEKAIQARAKAKDMWADFRVVDFNSMSFDEQVKTMQDTHVLIATHGAGNANIIFMRPGAAFVEVFPFSYKAGPFDGFAKIFGLQYSTAMSAPQTSVFKTCMNQLEKNDFIRRLAFEKWDQAVGEDMQSPWVHRLEFEKEFGEPGKSQGMTTRGCVRLQQLKFNIEAVSNTAINAGRSQCHLASNSK